MLAKSADVRRLCDCRTQLILLLMREGCLELVVDAVVRHRPQKGTKAGARKPSHRHTRQWIEHQQPRKSTDQHTGGKAPRRTKRRQVDRLFDMDLTGLSVDHNTGILQVDKVLLLH